jgi:DNA-binding protein YbaB
MIFQKVTIPVWSCVSVLVTVVTACAAPEPRLYSIIVPGMSCERAHELSTTVMERLGYTVAQTAPVAGSEPGVIRGARKGPQGDIAVSVKITCDHEKVHIDANPDISPCEQANRITRQSVEKQGYAITEFKPAVMDGQIGVVAGTKEEDGKSEAVELTITCSREVVHIETSSDNPVLVSTNFAAAIIDFRRGFFSVFKPLADAEQHTQGR